MALKHIEDFILAEKIKRRTGMPTMSRQEESLSISDPHLSI